MKTDLNEPSGEDLKRQREATRRELTRANTAGWVIVLLVLALALAAVTLAFSSQRHAEQATAERARAEEQLYLASLAQARAERLAGRTGQRVKSLEAVRGAARLRPSPDLREQAIAALALPDLEEEGTWLRLPTNTVRLAVDSSFQNYAVGLGPREIVVRSLASNRIVWSITNSPALQLELQFSPDGRFLRGAEAGALVLWDLKDGGTVLTLGVSTNAPQIRDMSFSLDSRRLACIDNAGTLRVYETSTGALEIEVPGLDRPWKCAFHPTRNLVAVECGQDIQLWDLDLRRAVQKFSRRPSGIGAMTWRRDGRLLAIGYHDHRIDVWDTELNRVQTLEGHTREIVSLLFHPKADLLLSYAWDGTTRAWDPVSGKQLIEAHGIVPLGFDAEGRRLAVWRGSEGLGFYRVHTPRECRLFTTAPGPPRTIAGLDFSPDATKLAGRNDEGIWVWSVATGELLSFGARAGIHAVHFLDDETLLTTGPEGLRRWSLPGAGGINGGSFGRMVMSPLISGKRLGSSGLDRARRRLVAHLDGLGMGTVIHLDTNQTGPELRGQPDFSRGVFSPDGRWIASACWNPISTKQMFAAIWDADTGKMLTNFPTAKCAVTFSPDSRWLLIGSITEYRLLETGTWKPQRSFARMNATASYGFGAFSPDGKWLALHATDRMLRLVNPLTGDELARFNAPDQRILGPVRFSPDGRWLAAATDANVQMWDLTGLRERLAEMDLDWEPPTNAEATLAGASGPRQSGFAHPSAGWFWTGISLTLLGMTIAITLAVWLRFYERGALARYLELDALLAHRNHQLIQAQAEVVHSEKMRALGTLAAGIAHDFNNLLSVIRMANKLTGEQTNDNADIQQNVQLVEKTVAQGKGVVRSMLGYSRKPGERGCYSVTAVVEETIKMLHQQFLGGITLDVSLAPDLPEVEGVRNRLEQILLNLMVNAAEAMEGRGRLRIATTAAPPREDVPWVLRPRAATQFVQIIIADSGPGMTTEVRERIFEPFFTTKSIGSVRGTGLGLSLVYAIAQEEGLGLILDSAPGQGTTFRILVPIGAHLDIVVKPESGGSTHETH